MFEITMKSFCQSFLFVTVLTVLLCLAGCDLEEFIEFISRLDQGDYAMASGNQGPYPGQGHVKLSFGLPLENVRIKYFRNGEVSHKFVSNEYGIFPARRGKVLVLIGDIELSDGPIWANLVSYPLITPMTLTGKQHSFSTDAEIMNRVRFVYSLSDELQSYLNWQEGSSLDELPRNIKIDPSYHEAAMGVDIDFDQTMENFSADSAVNNYIESIGKKLLPLNVVQAIFQQTLFVDQDPWGAAALSPTYTSYMLDHKIIKDFERYGRIFESRSPVYGECSRVWNACEQIFMKFDYDLNPVEELSFCLPDLKAGGESSFHFNGVDYEVARFGYNRGLRMSVELISESNNIWYFSYSNLLNFSAIKGQIASTMELEADKKNSFVKICNRSVESNE